MKQKIENIDKSILKKIREITKNNVEGKNLLSISELRFNRQIIFQFIIALIIFIILLFNLGWNEIYWIYGATLVFSYFFIQFVFLILSYIKIRKCFLYFDESIILKKERDIVEFYPVEQLTEINFVNSDVEGYVMLKLTLINNILFYPYKRRRKKIIESFSNNLIQVSNNAKNRPKNSQVLSFSLLNDLLYINSDLENRKKHLKINILLMIVFSVLIIITLPYFLDWNSYRKATEINSATSFREYLKQDKNHIYRDAAKQLIREKYDEAILHYKKNNANAKDNEAFVKILDYLKNNEIYNLNVLFQNINKIKDISKDYDVKIESAEYSFTRQKNKNREDELILTLNKALGNTFPSDIIKIEEIRDTKNVPKIEIMYTYTNSEDGSLYYPVSQENVSEKLRDYYYGLTIYWDFELYIPTQSDPIYSFRLKSNPAVQFSSETYSGDNVYSNMVYSAFRDFDIEFKKYFFRE